MVELCRWNDRWGNSDGWSLVKEVPGLSVYRRSDGKSWGVKALFPARIAPCYNLDTEKIRVWGPDADLLAGQRLMEKHPSLSESFPSPEAASKAIEKALQPEEKILTVKEVLK